MLSLFYCNAAQQSAETKARDYGFLKEEEADAPLMGADLSHSEIGESSLLLFIEILYDMLYYKLSIMFRSSLLLNCLSCTMLSPSSQFGSHLRTSCATVTALLCSVLFCCSSRVTLRNVLIYVCRIYYYAMTQSIFLTYMNLISRSPWGLSRTDICAVQSR